MSGAVPRLSIGLPVYNGERYVAAAIQSVIDSTYTDWELNVSDNASTDGTAEIVRGFAAQDPRIRYDRNPVNIGALPNFNKVFHAARGEYFKWLAYDDVCGPEFLARCIDVLDADPSVVLCSSRFREIDQSGALIRDQPYDVVLTARAPHRRLGQLMRTKDGHPILYGVIRTETLRRTHLLAPYHGSDRALLAELTLYGRLWEIPEVLWSSREHPDRSVYVRSTMAGWDKPDGHRLPSHIVIAMHLGRSIATAPISGTERLRCAAELAGRVATRAPELAPVFAAEVVDALRTVARRTSG